jgi:hypothetical protein
MALRTLLPAHQLGGGAHDLPDLEPAHLLGGAAARSAAVAPADQLLCLGRGGRLGLSLQLSAESAKRMMGIQLVSGSGGSSER